MKRAVAFATLGLAVSLCSAVRAQSSVTIYGVADAGVEVSNSGKKTLHRVTSGGLAGNRLGFRGSEDLGDGLRGIFTLEMGLNIDDGTLGQGGRAFGRESAVGLSSAKLGTLTMGRIRTPYYMTQLALDAFAWGPGGLVAVTRSGPTTGQLLPLVINGRSDNAINYVSPDLGGIELRAQVAAGEGSTTIGRSYGASARYVKDRSDLVATVHVQRGAGNAGSVRASAVGGNYDFTVARMYAGYTVERNDCATCTGALARMPGVTPNGASEFRLMNLGARVPVGLFTAIAQVTRISDRSDYAVAPGDRDATFFSVGGEYLLSKRTMLYGSINTIGNRNGSLYAVGAGSAQQPAGAVGPGDPRSKSIGVGIRHRF